MEADTGQTQVDLVRHGEHTLGHVVCGVTDPALTALGWTQLQQRIETLASHGSRWDICLRSPRRRCADFAQHMAREHGIPILQTGYTMFTASALLYIRGLRGLDGSW